MCACVFGGGGDTYREIHLCIISIEIQLLMHTSNVPSCSSSLLAVLPDHLNAEIVAGTITSKQDAMDYVTWTYFFRRLIMNPSFYQLEETSSDAVNTFLSRVVAKSLAELESSYCIEVEDVSVQYM